MCRSNSKAIIFFFALFALITFGSQAKAEKTILADDVNDKLRGMWLGQLIGNNAGRSTEGRYQSTPDPNVSEPWVLKQQWDADDDTDFEYIAMHILDTNGFDCNSQQIANQWRTHVTSSGIYIANRQAWYLMGDGNIPPQTGSRTYNEHWYSIDSQITTESLGAISPGLPQSAIDLAGKFAHISNEGFPVHAAQFYAALYANAFFEPNVLTLVTNGLNTIPTTSRTHQVITDVLNWYLDDVKDGDPNWRATRKKLYDYYMGSYSFGRYYYWIESTVNTGATVMAILYGQGDFKNTVQIGVLAGWDNDCNPATAGGLIGIINGYSGLPTDLTDPNICGNVYKNVYRPYLPDPNLYLPQYDAITNIAFHLTALAERNILDNGGYITYDPDKTYHIPDACEIIPEPEKSDPNGPNGLVADAISSGINVTPTAAVQYHTASSDRRNLDAIIDGNTDNSYNGRRPYYSYLTNINQRPQRDWYQLNFSQPVKFDGLTFYEGDIVWQEINTYYKTDNAQGGFFNDLTVEILRDGKFITPADLQISPALDRYKMYQTISFSFAPTVGHAIRIIGTPGGTEKFTTIMELEVAGDINTGLYVASVEIADGQLQRSTIKNISIQFSHNVTIIKNDVNLIGTTNGIVIDRNSIGFDYDNNTYSLTLSFSSSLPNDTYELSLDCNSVTDANGLHLLDDDQTPDNGYYTIKFHRLFGDADGSGKVDPFDMSLLASHWLNAPADTGLDVNDDNIINFPDFAVFANNWLCEF
jgi:hypothetical protein